jgi:hypothetical protein
VSVVLAAALAGLGALVADPRSGTILVLLTNQVQPDRTWSTKTPWRNVPRRTIAADVAAALPG